MPDPKKAQDWNLGLSETHMHAIISKTVSRSSLLSEKKAFQNVKKVWGRYSQGAFPSQPTTLCFRLFLCKVQL